MKNKRLLKKAKRKVKQKKDFYTHTLIIALVSVFLLSLRIFLKPWDGWGVLIPISIMILSVIIHYLMVFGVPLIKKESKNWEADAVENEYFKLKELELKNEDLLAEDNLVLRLPETRYRDEDFV